MEGVPFAPKGTANPKRVQEEEILGLVKSKKFWHFLDF
jgi:hypothetical protein